MMSVIKTRWSSIYLSYVQADDEYMKLNEHDSLDIVTVCNQWYRNKYKNKHVKMMHIEAYTQK